MNCRQCGELHSPEVMVCPRTQSSVLAGPCGTTVDRYAIEVLLGRGGAGSVYRAKHALLGRPVAIKLLRGEYGSNPDALRRFVREARIAATLGHPNVVRITDVGLIPDGGAFLVMDLLEGVELRAAIRATPRFPVERACDIALQMLAGLSVAHAVGVVHRDIKPANVFLAATRAPSAPPRDHALLLDFGISKLSEDTFGKRITYTGALLGTPRYMAPEQFNDAREVDGRADLYSVGVTLYHMLAGVPPFDGQNFDELLARVCNGYAIPLQQVAPHVPSAVVAVLARSMKVAKEERFPTALAMSEALRHALPGLPPDITWAMTSRPSQRPGAPVSITPPGPQQPESVTPQLSPQALGQIPPTVPQAPVAQPVAVPMTRVLPSVPPPARGPVAEPKRGSSVLLFVFVVVAGLGFVLVSGISAWVFTHRRALPNLARYTTRQGAPQATVPASDSPHKPPPHPHIAPAPTAAPRASTEPLSVTPVAPALPNAARDDADAGPNDVADAGGDAGTLVMPDAREPSRTHHRRTGIVPKHVYE